MESVNADAGPPQAVKAPEAPGSHGGKAEKGAAPDYPEAAFEPIELTWTHTDMLVWRALKEYLEASLEDIYVND